MEQDAREWLKHNRRKLPDMRAGKTKLTYVGSIGDLDNMHATNQPSAVINPRLGSDVYSKALYFSIETVQTKYSDMPGAPTMPVKQWLRYKPVHA